MKVNINSSNPVKKTCFFVFPLFLSILASLLQKNFNLLFVFFLLFLHLLVFAKEKRRTVKFPGTVDIAEFIIFIFSAIALALTGNFKSPLLPTFFAVYYSIAQNLTILARATSGAVAFLMVYAASMLLGEDFASLNSRLSMMMFLTMVFLLSIPSKSEAFEEVYKNKKTNKHSSTHKEKIVENLRSILDLTRRLGLSHDEKAALENYFQESPLCPPVCKILVLYRLEERAVLYDYKFDTKRVTSRLLTIPYRIDRSKVPEKIFDENSNEFHLSAYNEFFAIYHDSSAIQNVDKDMLYLIDNIFSETFLNIRFATYRRHILDKIIATKEFIRELSYSASLSQIFESAALTLKKISGAQKTFFLPYAETEKDVLNNAIFKGPLKLLPQKLWEQELMKLYRKISKHPEPSFLAKENFKIFAVPVRGKNDLYGILGGITELQTTTENSLSFAEFIAGLISMSVSSLSISVASGKIKTHSSFRIENNVQDVNHLFEELSYKLEHFPSKDTHAQIKTVKEMKNLVVDELSHKISLVENVSAGWKLKFFVGKISAIFKKSQELDIRDHIDETVDFDRTLFVPVATFLVEALLNSIVHSKSKGIAVSLFKENGKIHLKIADSGIGFELNRIIQLTKAKEKLGTGLRKMALIAKRINAKMKIKSKLNKGTEVELIFNERMDDM